MEPLNVGKVHIVGAGLAGLTAAITLAKAGIPVSLISSLPSERAQSNLAEGGINAALDTMGENDSPELHFEDTMRSGLYLAEEEAVRGLTEHAPELVRWLFSLGVPFHVEDGKIVQRFFGGQRKRRAAYADSATGKALVTALIDETRKYEARGLIHRFSHHELVRLLLSDGACTGVRIFDTREQRLLDFSGTVLLVTGGLNGFFPGRTTGTTANTGDAAAAVFSQGVRFSNLEMIQFHPTTIEIAGKRCLISEAARGEGGRLFVERDGKPWYFLEEKYPELKNLMPRDVVSREIVFVTRREDCGDTVFLDLTGLPEKVWEKKLSDLREEIIHYLGIDPKKTPVAVSPGIHYFMGGMDVNRFHETSLPKLYAAGECVSLYHGANRLGGNSLLGAIYGGKTAAERIASSEDLTDGAVESLEGKEPLLTPPSPRFNQELGEILYEGLSIVRSEERISRAIERLTELSAENQREENRKRLGLAMLFAARERTESRGAHYREDYPNLDESQRRMTVSLCTPDAGTVPFRQGGAAHEA